MIRLRRAWNCEADFIDWLGEEIGQIVHRADEGHADFERLNHVAHEEMPTLHMFHAIMVLRVVRNTARAQSREN